MSTMKRILSLLLVLCMMLGVCATAEQATEAPAEEELPVLNETDVVCVLNGQNITWGDCLEIYNNLVDNYGSYYDLTTAADVTLFYAAALNQYIGQMLLMLKGEELGLTNLTEEEIAAVYESADTDWNTAVESYISYFYSDLDTSDEAKVAEATAEAEAYYADLGYTNESLREIYLENEKLGRVSDYMVQDAVVTDEEVEAYYQSLVDADKELYENDLAAYCEYNSYVDMMAYYSAYYGTDSDMDYAWYRPEGYRAVKHILIPVDEELMNTWTDLTAKLEEQAEEAAEAEEAAAEATADPSAEATAEPEATEEPVTQEMVDAAYEAIIASKQELIDEINQKIAEGVDFDELIATYGVDADGNASDPGMTTEPYKTDGYEVCQYTSDYVQAFVDAAMSIPEVGGVSDPYVSSYGIHILKYLKDIPAGAVELTDEERQAMYEDLLDEKKNTLYDTLYEEWLAAATVEYTGLIPNIEDLQN